MTQEGRRKLLVAAGVWLALPAVRTLAQSSAALIGYLSADAVSIDKPRQDAFRRGLRDLGYVEGRNIRIEARIADGDFAKIPAQVGELLKLRPNVIFAFTTPAVRALKAATREVPVVFVAHTPVELGLVSSLARPGGNMTGLTLTPGPEIYGKYLELLAEIVPDLRRIGVLFNPANANNKIHLASVEEAARKLDVGLTTAASTKPADIDEAFARFAAGGARGLVVLADPMLLGQRQRLAALGIERRLPSIYAIPEHVSAGGLASYAADRLDQCRRAALFVDKILKGAKPADLPIEQPTTLELALNLKTARAIGLTLPPSLIVRANRVID